MEKPIYTVEQIDNMNGHTAYNWARTLNSDKNFFEDEELRNNPHDTLKVLLGIKRRM